MCLPTSRTKRCATRFRRPTPLRFCQTGASLFRLQDATAKAVEHAPKIGGMLWQMSLVLPGLIEAPFNVNDMRGHLTNMHMKEKLETLLLFLPHPPRVCGSASCHSARSTSPLPTMKAFG